MSNRDRDVAHLYHESTKLFYLDLQRTPPLMQFLADLEPALEQDDGQKLGGKSAEAARFILRAIDRELDRA